LTEKLSENRTETEKRSERLTENRPGLIEKHQKLIEKLIEKAARQGDKLTGNRISILRLVMDDPYISKADLSKLVGISVAAISANIEVLRGKYLRRVGPDKGGFWECIRGRRNSLLESQHKVNSSSNSR
jgi:ATP-dependent DNA helicase RecG